MKISVVVCTCNGELYIKEQLESILCQTRRVDEIILLDDCSKDHTVEKAEEILHRGGIAYQIVRNPQNLGVAANFEKGIRMASGDVILTADQDDVWMENKAELFEQLFEEKENCVLAFSDGRLTDAGLHVIRDSIWEAAQFTKLRQQKFRDRKYYEVLFSDNVITGAAMGIRKSFALSCVPAPKGTLHDYWYALCAPLWGEIELLDAPCILYRQHGRNVMGMPGRGLRGKIKRYLGTIKVLSADRENRWIRAKALLEYADGIQNADRYKAQLAGWLKFSGWRHELGERRLGGIVGILRHALRGEYRKYTDKPGIVLQDIISCLQG